MNSLKKIARSMLLTATLGLVLIGSMSLCIDPFEDGFWINEDPNTGGITQAYVQFYCNDQGQPGPEFRMYLWGSCSPSDCFWGGTDANTVGDWVLGEYDQGFAKRKVWIKESAFFPGKLYMYMQTDFVDPNRADYVWTGYFNH